MAPPVLNSADLSRWDSLWERKWTFKSTAPIEPTLNIDNKLESAAPSTDEVSQSPIESVSELTSNKNLLITDTIADVVDAAPVSYIHPWDGPPAKEPDYPPGTYRGMF